MSTDTQTSKGPTPFPVADAAFLWPTGPLNSSSLRSFSVIDVEAPCLLLTKLLGWAGRLANGFHFTEPRRQNVPISASMRPSPPTRHLPTLLLLPGQSAAPLFGGGLDIVVLTGCAAARSSRPSLLSRANEICCHQAHEWRELASLACTNPLPRRISRCCLLSDGLRAQAAEGRHGRQSMR